MAGTYIFVDGPNLFESSKRNFRVDLGKLFSYLEKYGKVERKFWYDVEPEISPIDFQRTPTPKLGPFSLQMTDGRSSLETLLGNVREKSGEQEAILKEAASFYSSIQRTKADYEGRVSFLRYVKNVADVVMEKGRVYEGETYCSECACPVSYALKTEAGKTDFNLATDVIYHAAMNSFETAVIISGDGHFSRPLQYVKDLKKKTIVSSFRDSLNPELKTIANEVIELDSIRASIERQNGTYQRNERR